MKKYLELETKTALKYALKCLEYNPDSVFWSDGSGAIVYVNHAACTKLGYSKDELTGMNIKDIDTNYSPENFEKIKELLSSLPKGELKRLQSMHKHRDGHLIPVDIFIGELEPKSSSLGFSFVRDMTDNIKTEKDLKHAYRVLQDKNRELVRLYGDIKRREDQLKFLAYHDELTGLSNRNLLMETIRQHIAAPDACAHKFALLFIDLDNFKNINDSLGHSIGDEVLIEVSKRLGDTIPDTEHIYRFGGDEFIILIYDVEDIEDLNETAQQVKNCLLPPICYEMSSIYLACSIGVAVFPSDAETAEGLLMFADAAMYRAKLNGKDRIHFFSSEMKQDVLSKIDFQNKLREALDHNEFYLVYQPQYSVKRSRQYRGLEALIRWENPTLGSVSPMVLIPAAEEMGLIVPIGKWVMVQACNTARRWQREFGFNGIISVNISAIQLNSPGFINDVREALALSGLDPTHLELEITESTFIASFEATVSILHELRELGVRICLDDFGTGYSSLGYLMQLPVDTLKIDKTFILQKNITSKQKHILQSIIALVNGLDIKTVVEGVKTKEQFDFIKTTKSDYLQGFLFSRPLKETDVELLFTQEGTAIQ